MRKYWVILISLLLISCASPNKNYVQATYTAGTFVANQLIKYVEKDKEIDKKSRETRINSVKNFLRMLQEEQNRVNGENNVKIK